MTGVQTCALPIYSGKIREKYLSVLVSKGIQYEEGGHTEEKIMNASEVIKSPGIPETAPIVAALSGKGIPVISEIEFAGRFTDALKICITGSNGKTTTTNLVYHILKNAGLRVAMTGNVGNSFAMSVYEGGYDYYVIELSSFQLDNMYSFRADIAVLLNITPDHLDRYGYEMKNYVASKFRIVNNQGQGQYFIWCADDPVLRAELAARTIDATMLPFSIESHEGMSAYVENDELIIEYNEKTRLMTMYDLALKGRHNTYNSMAAAIVANVLNIRKETIRQSLSDFQGVEHRLEHVLTVCGINFVNDSKATNVNSTWYALECMPSGIVWIAGGIDKGNDYSELLQLVRQKVKAIVCLGKDNKKIISSFSDAAPTIVEAGAMEEAVRSAYYLANKGEIGRASCRERV